MIQGLGNDIIEIERLQKAIERQGQRFLDRVFTPAEQQYCLRHNQAARHFAGRFAAKESVLKGLGTGLRQGITWLDIEITNDDKGKPIVTLSPALQAAFNQPLIFVSISHCQQYAAAVAIVIAR